MQPEIFEAHPDLAPFVKCFWNLESPREETPVSNTIVPDGCMKLIFHYKDPYRYHPANQPVTILPRCFLIGQLTGPYEVEPMGETGTFFVCFRPNGFLPFTTASIKSMENTAVPLQELFGVSGQQYGEQILKANSTVERIQISESFLLTKLTEAGTFDSLVESTIDTIFSAGGRLSVSELSDIKQVSRRQLVRKFSSTIGLSPKQLSKTVRLQAALKTLLVKEDANFTSLAYENEYFDQAHFIKDFKEFTGLTPKEFYGEDLKMSLIFEQKE